MEVAVNNVSIGGLQCAAREEIWERFGTSSIFLQAWRDYHHS